MKLRAALTAQPLQLLRRIADETSLDVDNHSNKPALIDHLSRHLAQPASIRTRLKTLPSPSRDLVVHLASEGGELLRSVAVDQLGHGFEHRFDEMVETLTLNGLAFSDAESYGRDTPIVGVPESILRSIPIPNRIQSRLRALLAGRTVGQLRGFANELNVEDPGTKRPILVERIRDHLTDTDNLKAYLKSLSEERREVLDYVLAEAESTPRDVEARLGEGALRHLGDLIWKTPLFVPPEGSRLDPSHTLQLAQEVAEALKSLADTQGGKLEGRPEDALNDETPPPNLIAAPGEMLPRDLATLLGLIERRRPKTLKRGGMPKGELREAARFFKADEDPGYPDFLMLFAEEFKLLVPESGRWVLARSASRRLTNQARLIQAFVDFWQKTDRWNEWAADRVATNGRKNRSDELIALRGEVLHSLSRCPNDKWVAYAQFYRTLSKLSPAFKLLTEGPASGTILASRGTTADELLRRMLVGALSWTGIIEIGNRSAFDRPLHASEGACFRLSSAGRRILKQTDDNVTLGIPPDANSRFVVQPNLEVLAPPELPASDYIQLCALTDLRDIDVVCRFQVTREAILDALNRGSTSTRILRFFRERSATGVPDMVKSLVKDTDDKHGEIKVRLASGFVQVEKGTLLDELFAQKQIAEHLGSRLSSKVASIAAGERPETLAQVLTRQGYMPALEHMDQSETVSSHQITLSTSDLSDLVGFLESGIATLDERLGEYPGEIASLAKRLRRILRRTPGETVAECTDAHTERFAELVDRVRQSDGRATLAEFKGRNPAKAQKDILKTVDFAIRKKLCIRLGYGAKTNTGRVVQPTSEDEKMLYAYCRNRKGNRVFRLDKIWEAELLAEAF